ncbi:hypothetical protein OHA72_36770 [Dactylosporangium sp. NBC_01737]|uniref:hypothetical protein n=1 Tax=Dactylosporangium sp. NBC_01737 TaxID=2975959 RepID=UPI002E159E48|nr:hypothetical protein OHA72_36770 [Dactylosporangium sp. NBC_01737]
MTQVKVHAGRTVRAVGGDTPAQLARPCTPGSPYSFDPQRHPNEPAHGTTHIWDVWNTLDHTGCRSTAPRFVAEFGLHVPPTRATLTRAVHDEPLRPDSPGVRLHQEAADGNAKLAGGMSGHLPPPETFEDWHWATSLNQACALAFGVEQLRSLTPLCMGAVRWQLNDVWPVISWSAVDGDGRCKPMWYALRRSFRDRLLTVQPREGGLALVAVNDSGLRWCVDVPVRRCDVDGAVLAAASVSPEAFPDPLVLRSANQLVAGPDRAAALGIGGAGR